MEAEKQVFTKSELDRMLQPIDHAFAPPAKYYTSKEQYDLELKHIFYKDWLWVGRVDQLKKPGDYLALTVVDEPIVILRDQSNILRAFSAVCRHRGAVLAEGEGNCRVFTCPYHSWVYNLEGKLTGAPEMNKVHGFKASEYGLLPIKVEAWEGSLLINFDPNSESLSTTLGDFYDYVKNYKMGEMITTDRATYEFQCNWKMLVENAMEAYHIVGTHNTAKESAYAQMRFWRDEDPHGAYEILTFEHDAPLSMNLPGSAGEPASLIETLTPVEQKRHYFALLKPNMLYILQPDCVCYFVMNPIGPDRVDVLCEWAYPKSTTEKPNFEEIRHAAFIGVDSFNQQDVYTLNRTMKGYRSRLFNPGRFALKEGIPYRFAKYVLGRTAQAAA